MTAAVLLFVASGTVIVVAGTLLTRAADVIADGTGLGRLWIGAVLLAAATSLPELTTDVAAVRLGAPDLAAGDLFGSSMANMALLAVIGLMGTPVRVLQSVTLEHALTASLAMVLNGLAAVFVMTGTERTLLGVSPGSLLLLLGFVFGMRVVYRNGARHEVTAGPVAPGSAQTPRLVGAAVRFAAACAAIVLTAPLFARSAQMIAALSGLGEGFVGNSLVALSTSLPELVSSITAVRIGAVDMAVANLFGSNSFNMAIFFAMDLADPSTSIFATLSPEHVVAALLATVLMALGLAAIAYRAERRWALVEPGSALMLGVYAVGMWILYLRSQ